MANQIKGLWLVVLLVASGVVIFFLSLGQNKDGSQGVVLEEVFKQAPPVAQEKKAEPKEEAGGNKGILVSEPVVVNKRAPQINDPVPPMAIVTSPTDGQERGFTIQVYSFQDKGRSQAALASLKSNGYNAFEVVSDLGEKGTWYRVRVGGIADEAEAKDILEKIRKNYNSGFIIKEDK